MSGRRRTIAGARECARSVRQRYLLSINDKELLAEFVGSFRVLDDLQAHEGPDPDAWALRAGKPGRFGARWRPRAVRIGRAALERLNARLPHRYPGLFESLLVSYRWATVELPQCALLPSAPGTGLSGFESHVFRDPVLSRCLLAAGYLQFARVRGGSYDPVCFDFSTAKGSSEARVVALDHEAILCHERIVLQSELAPSFRQLATETVLAARRRE